MAVDTAIRLPVFLPYYHMANNYLLLLAAVIAWYAVSQPEKYASYGILLVMANNLLDAYTSGQGQWGINDTVTAALLPVLASVGYVKRPDWYSGSYENLWILAAVVPAKLLCTNIFIEFSPEKNSFFFGDALCYFLIALYIIRTYKLHIFVIPAVFLLLTANNLLDETLYHPVEGRLNEIIFVSWGFVMIVWWKLRERYGVDDESRRLFNHIAIALNVVMLAGETFLFLR